MPICDSSGYSQSFRRIIIEDALQVRIGRSVLLPVTLLYVFDPATRFALYYQLLLIHFVTPGCNPFTAPIWQR